MSKESIVRIALLAAVLAAGISCESNWEEFKSPDGTFVVWFPSAPELNDQGQRKTWRAAAGSTVFTVGVQAVPAEFLSDTSADRLLESVQKSAETEAQKDATGVKAIFLGPEAFPGREFSFSVPTKAGPGNMTMRAYRVNEQLFVLTMMELAGDPFGEAERFWSSFSVTGE